MWQEQERKWGLKKKKKMEKKYIYDTKRKREGKW